MLRLVIDTNVLLAAVGKRSEYHWLWQAFLERKFNLCVSTEILLEYEEVFRSKLSDIAATLIIEIITESANTINCSPAYRWSLIIDDLDDNKFVDAAIQSKADYIITHDKHFNVLKTISFPKISILNINELKNILISS